MRTHPWPISFSYFLCFSKERTLRSACALGFFVLLVSAAASWPQVSSATVNIRVHADQPDGTTQPVWSFFGYDEPNYTYASNGKKLLD